MSYKQSSYIAKPVDNKGNVSYTEEEHRVWHELINRQYEIIRGRACNEYIYGLDLLNMPKDRIPQCHEISNVLQETTGWSLEPVAALISFERFFTLLANRRFPAATFIRTWEDLDYLQEPDIFHEIFGHCPLLTNPAYADFTHEYGKLALAASKEDRAMLARLYWFTIEFGLIKENNNLRIYGGGILSSIDEAVFSLESSIPERKSFDVLDALRTPYRIDIKQPVYFIIDNFNVLYDVIGMDLISKIREARQLGEFKPLYPI